MYELGCCYDNGDGVEQNFTKAVEWYAKAARKGDQEAWACLSRLVGCPSPAPQVTQAAGTAPPPSSDTLCRPLAKVPASHDDGGGGDGGDDGGGDGGSTSSSVQTSDVHTSCEKHASRRLCL